jgi:CheY-like chemotaxis protein
MCHVLIIEDNWMIADHVAHIATSAGATSIDQAYTEKEAVAAALAHPPGVILSDVHLIEGTGPLAVSAIRQQLGDLPVIFITATPDACEPCGYAAAVLTKPVSAGPLMREFRRVAPLAR